MIGKAKVKILNWLFLKVTDKELSILREAAMTIGEKSYSCEWAFGLNNF